MAKNTPIILLMAGMAMLWRNRLAMIVPRMAGARIPAITHG
jgi:hypothetical protein